MTAMLSEDSVLVLVFILSDVWNYRVHFGFGAITLPINMSTHKTFIMILLSSLWSSHTFFQHRLTRILAGYLLLTSVSIHTVDSARPGSARTLTGPLRVILLQRNLLCCPLKSISGSVIASFSEAIAVDYEASIELTVYGITKHR